MKPAASGDLAELTLRDETPHFYGRRKGRRLRTTMRDLLEKRLPELRFRPEHPAQPQFEGAPEDLFLEIGFGGGENLVAIAACRPDAAFIGAEPFINGVASLVRHIEERHLTNIRIWDDDVRLILGGLESGSLAGAYVLFPDPWPKRRHAAADPGADVLDELARLIRLPGASFWQDHSVAKAGLKSACCTPPSADGATPERLAGTPAAAGPDALHEKASARTASELVHLRTPRPIRSPIRPRSGTPLISCAVAAIGLYLWEQHAVALRRWPPPTFCCAKLSGPTGGKGTEKGGRNAYQPDYEGARMISASPSCGCAIPVRRTGAASFRSWPSRKRTVR